MRIFTEKARGRNARAAVDSRRRLRHGHTRAGSRLRALVCRRNRLRHGRAGLQKSLYAPFPAALEDCYLALLWLKENGEKYGMRRDKIFVGGNSAGGGMTAALTLYARDKGEVNIAFQMPLYPMLDDRPTKLQRTTTLRSGTQNRTSPRGSCISATTTVRTGSRNTPRPRARRTFPVCRRRSRSLAV